MNLFAHFQALVIAELAAMAAAGELPPGLDVSRVAVEPPREAAHGDIATNAAMVLAKPAGINPRALAEKLKPRLKANKDVASVEVAGPGFINLRLKPSFWPKVLESAHALGAGFGRSELGRGLKVNCEYVSANPTGPLHIGHCRGAIFGDALAELLTVTGHDVTKEYYINDAGAQIDVLARSAFLRYRQALGHDIGEMPSGFYPGDYLKPVGEALARQFGDRFLAMPEAEWLPMVRDRSVAMMMDLIREDLALIGIRHEVFFSEKALAESGEIDRTIEELRVRGLVYEGRLPPPKGELPPDWEDREQTLFRTSDFGDDIDRPLRKADGTHAYFAADVAYSRAKIMRGFKELIYVLGADHGGYIKRLEAIASALAGKGAVKVVVRLCQLVKLYRGGEPVKMSKRAGEFVTLREMVEEVGPDVLRFMMLFRKNEAPLDFDFAKATEQSKDNPVFYVQYAHARICSVFRNAEEAGLTDSERDFLLLDDPGEMALVRRVAEYPRLVEAAAVAHEPHRIAFYLHDLASEFHALWNKGKESPHLRFILTSDKKTSATRLALLRVIRYVLANGLAILGVRPAAEM
jgi:arginyl-tRNA synthetase